MHAGIEFSHFNRDKQDYEHVTNVLCYNTEYQQQDCKIFHLSLNFLARCLQLFFSPSLLLSLSGVASVFLSLGMKVPAHLV